MQTTAVVFFIISFTHRNIEASNYPESMAFSGREQYIICSLWILGLVLWFSFWKFWDTEWKGNFSPYLWEDRVNFDIHSRSLKMKTFMFGLVQLYLRMSALILSMTMLMKALLIGENTCLNKSAQKYCATKEKTQPPEWLNFIYCNSFETWEQ